MNWAAYQKALDWKGHAYVGLVARLYLGWLFVSACLHKIARPEAFAVDVATYQLLPLTAINAFAIYVPWLELLVGVFMLIGWRVRSAALLISTLMVSFMIALAWALYLGLDMSCGCFASQAAAANDTISWHTLVRDSGWLVLGLYVLWFDRRPLGLERWLSRSRDTKVASAG